MLDSAYMRAKCRYYVWGKWWKRNLTDETDNSADTGTDLNGVSQ